VKAPRVSIILLSLNQAAYLRASIESALRQTFDDFEVILIENGSTDGSRAIADQYRDDQRLRLVAHDEHAWPGVRFNQAVATARGELVCFLYSDDVYLPAKLAREVSELERRGPAYGVVYSRAMRRNVYTGERVVAPCVAADGDVFEPLMRDGLRRGELDMITPMIRRSLLLEHPFHEDIIFESEGIFHRLALYTKFAFIDEPLTMASDHDANAGKALTRQRAISCACLARLRREAGLRPQQLPLIDRYEGELLRYYGWQGARLGATRAWTLGCYRDAVRVSPRQLLHPKTAVGVALCLSPRALRDRINAVGHRIRGSALVPVLVEDYETLRPPGKR
jgi:glycosyltransferase involved in cell wall biosynthesis